MAKSFDLDVLSLNEEQRLKFFDIYAERADLDVAFVHALYSILKDDVFALFMLLDSKRVLFPSRQDIINIVSVIKGGKHG